MRPLRIAIVFDALALAPGAPADVAGVLETVDAVQGALGELGHFAWRVSLGGGAAALQRALAALLAAPPDLVFNLCESVNGAGDGEARVIAALELAGIPVTGAPAEVITLARRKDRVAAVLSAHGVPTPPGVTVADTAPPEWTSYPCIVKPSGADGSVGITQASVARDASGLATAVAAARGHGPLLVQPLLTGRELNVAVVGETVLSCAEIEYVDVPEGAWPIVDYAAKWEPGSVSDRMSVPRCPARLDAALAEEARALALRAWRAVEGRGVGRIDLRADAQGRLHVLEVNPNPDLAPSAGLARMAAAAGWSYRGLVARIVEDALAATGPAQPEGDAVAAPSHLRPHGHDAGGRGTRAPLRIGPLPVSARAAVEGILGATGMFRPDEVAVALEVIDAYFANPDRDYTALGAFSQDGELVGYSCHGPTPCTLGTCDLYWIAVAPAAQRTGAGSALLQEVERRLAEMDARVLLIETSSQPRYLPTRAFYERHGYVEVARVPEFYAPGDDRVIFAKRIPTACRG